MQFLGFFSAVWGLAPTWVLHALHTEIAVQFNALPSVQKAESSTNTTSYPQSSALSYPVQESVTFTNSVRGKLDQRGPECFGLKERKVKRHNSKFRRFCLLITIHNYF